MHARRALLYMPGDDLRKIHKATTLGVDCICMDMEDGVALNRKAEARQTIVEALHTLDFGGSERLARINAIGSGFEEDDLAAVLPARPDGIVIPKVENAEQIALRGRHHRRIRRAVRLGASAVCTSWRWLNRRAASSTCNRLPLAPRLQGIIFGAEDFASDIGARRTPEGLGGLLRRAALWSPTPSPAVCRRSTWSIIDFKDTPGLVREAEQGAGLGFTGKQIIHPNQVEPVQEAFTPSDDSNRLCAAGGPGL